ncbi:MAG TPA: DUF6716 putative glycosyltransferase [Microlunatus sp.]
MAIADSDSYLKWSAATLQAMPAGWQSEQWLIKNPIAPSPAQVRAATDRRVDRLGFSQLAARLRRRPPDVLLLAATGPVVQAVLGLGFLRRGGRRPVLVTGLPGISYPASARAVQLRAGCDLFILHSRHEVSEFAELAGGLGIKIDFGLATLPFIEQSPVSRASLGRPDGHGERAAGSSTPPQRKIIFAAQAKVPTQARQRKDILRTFATLPPDRRVVIKLRALSGEQQTHREDLPYPQLWQELVRDEGYDPDRVEFVAGSMADALADADGFVTVSSTAALEAIGADVPILILSDFGVSAEMINEVFIGSDCLGPLDELAGPQLRRPSTEWLRDNYFHDQEDVDWIDKITELTERRAGSGLSDREAAGVGRVRLIRRQLRLLLPQPVLQLTGRAARAIKRSRRRLLLGPEAEAVEANEFRTEPEG